MVPVVLQDFNFVLEANFIIGSIASLSLGIYDILRCSIPCDFSPFYFVFKNKQLPIHSACSIELRTVI